MGTWTLSPDSLKLRDITLFSLHDVVTQNRHILFLLLQKPQLEVLLHYLEIMSGRFMAYQKLLYLIEVLNLLQSSWRNLMIYWGSKLNYQWHTIHKQTDKQNESIKRLNSISDYSSVIDRTIGQNGLQVLSSLTTIKPYHYTNFSFLCELWSQPQDGNWT